MTQDVKRRFDHLKIVVEKSTAWKCEEHYLIDLQKYFHSVHTAQSTE